MAYVGQQGGLGGYKLMMEVASGEWGSVGEWNLDAVAMMLRAWMQG